MSEKIGKNKGAIMFVCWMLFVGLLLTRVIVVEKSRMKFSSYALDYVCFLMENDEETNVSFKDTKIIRNMLLPNFLVTAMNPFKWTEEQISDDDELLRECKAAWEIREKKRNVIRNTTEQSFSERRKTWEKINPKP